MKEKRKPFILLVIKHFTHRESHFGLLGDMEEMYRMKSDKHAFKARIWFINESYKLFFHCLLDWFFWRFVMFKNYLKAALRNMQRNKVYSFIKVFGLAVGMACCMLILLWIRDEMSYDRYHENAHRLYRVLYGLRDEGDLTYFALSPFGSTPVLNADIPDVIDYTRIERKWAGLFTVGNKSFEEDDIYFVDTGFFRLFSHEFLEGRPEGALDEPGSVVLTESRAMKLFGRIDVVGETIHLDQEGDIRITGVIANVPGCSHMQFDYVVSNHRAQRRMPELYTSWDWMRGWSYVLLENGADPDAVVEKFDAILDKYRTEGVSSEGRRGVMTLQPVTDIHLKSQLLGELETNGSVSNVIVFSSVAFFILLIACINFMNLATARSLGRSREVGMRKVMGAYRTHMMTQFMSDG